MVSLEKGCVGVLGPCPSINHPFHRGTIYTLHAVPVATPLSEHKLCRVAFLTVHQRPLVARVRLRGPSQILNTVLALCGALDEYIRSVPRHLQFASVTLIS